MCQRLWTCMNSGIIDFSFKVAPDEKSQNYQFQSINTSIASKTNKQMFYLSGYNFMFFRNTSKGNNHTVSRIVTLKVQRNKICAKTTTSLRSFSLNLSFYPRIPQILVLCSKVNLLLTPLWRDQTCLMVLRVGADINLVVVQRKIAFCFRSD